MATLSILNIAGKEVNMVKLKVKESERLSKTMKRVFYFKDMEDCERFLYVFKDHYCNVPWDEPEESDEFSNMDVNDIYDMDEDPVDRADRSLGWGFSLCDSLEIGLTNYQKEEVRMIMNMIEEGMNK